MRQIYIILASTFLISCIATPAKESHKYIKPDLTDNVLRASSGDISKLYNNWIKPLRQGFLRIKHNTRSELVQTERAIQSGFEKFCRDSNGASKLVNKKYGVDYDCSNETGYVGGLLTTREKGLSLTVKYHTPETKKEINDYEFRMANNGPSGYAIIDGERRRFLRIGTLYKRDLVIIDVKNKNGKMVPIEKFKSIKFNGSSGIELVTHENKKYNLPTSAVKKRLSKYSTGSYGSIRNALKLVLMDKLNKEPYTHMFYSFKRVSLIEFDSPSKYIELQNVEIKSNLDLTSKDRVNKYFNDLTIEAQSLYKKADTKGYLKLLPDDQKLTPSLQSYLKSQLDYEISRTCQDNIRSGMSDVKRPLKCYMARREKKIVVRGNYSLSPELTPLSTILVISKMQEDFKI